MTPEKTRELQDKLDDFMDCLFYAGPETRGIYEKFLALYPYAGSPEFESAVGKEMAEKRWRRHLPLSSEGDTKK